MSVLKRRIPLLLNNYCTEEAVVVADNSQAAGAAGNTVAVVVDRRLVGRKQVGHKLVDRKQVGHKDLVHILVVDLEVGSVRKSQALHNTFCCLRDILYSKPCQCNEQP